MRAFFLTILVFSLSFTAGASNKTIHPLVKEAHPLIDKIWDVRAQRFVSQADVAQALLAADYIFLGESHDNPLHHEWQGWAIETLVRAGKKPAIAFEMIDDEQAKGLVGASLTSADAVFDAVKWDQSGWPPRELYRPVFAPIVAAKLPIYSANLPREALRKIISNASAPSDDIAQLLKARPLNDNESKAMLKELEESHCNMLPSQHVNGMITGQRVRDALMALSLLKQNQANPAVLVAGKAHGRLDRGAPSFLRTSKPEAHILSIGWHEVEENHVQPTDYNKMWQTETLPFDFVWFTARVDRPEPCDEIKAFLKKKANNEEAKPKPEKE